MRRQWYSDQRCGVHYVRYGAQRESRTGPEISIMFTATKSCNTHNLLLCPQIRSRGSAILESPQSVYRFVTSSELFSEAMRAHLD
ncbi:hypothetical protein FVE85_4457 [Porphyridium purpureum]|uniref:Uncharacterized protein n=1 Tax=Porphyridium purpureum TaxID=35688 RepID=A0A5J4YJL4_PORPP|nr:hypothetical protein FVE85_4457 [Porphyridium purpureum]|eukprot:POR3710..scf297_16